MHEISHFATKRPTKNLLYSKAQLRFQNPAIAIGTFSADFFYLIFGEYHDMFYFYPHSNQEGFLLRKYIDTQKEVSLVYILIISVPLDRIPTLQNVNAIAFEQ